MGREFPFGNTTVQPRPQSIFPSKVARAGQEDTRKKQMPQSLQSLFGA